MKVRRLHGAHPDFRSRPVALDDFESPDVEAEVRAILADVRVGGDEALDVATLMAPEHLELSVAEPERLLGRVRHAGAVFPGRHATEVPGDHCAGPNHVLSTGRSARFPSPLGVDDFRKGMNVNECTAVAARRLGAVAMVLAKTEGRTAHARTAELRMSGGTPTGEPG